MKTIEITMERTIRRAEEFEVSDEDYEYIQRTSRLPAELFDRMEQILDKSFDDCEYDYAIWSETEQKQLVDWG